MFSRFQQTPGDFPEKPEVLINSHQPCQYFIRQTLAIMAYRHYRLRAYQKGNYRTCEDIFAELSRFGFLAGWMILTEFLGHYSLHFTELSCWQLWRYKTKERSSRFSIEEMLAMLGVLGCPTQLFVSTKPGFSITNRGLYAITCEQNPRHNVELGTQIALY